LTRSRVHAAQPDALSSRLAAALPPLGQLALCDLPHHQSPEERHVPRRELELAVDQVQSARACLEGLAREDAAVRAVVLLWRVLGMSSILGRSAWTSTIRTHRVEGVLPSLKVEWLALLHGMFRVEVLAHNLAPSAERSRNVAPTTAAASIGPKAKVGDPKHAHPTHVKIPVLDPAEIAHRVVILDPLLPEIDDPSGPMQTLDIDREHEHILIKQVDLIRQHASG
jgi:hypothetical protein